MYPPIRNPKVKFRNAWGFGDILLFLAIVSLIFAIISTADNFTGVYNPNLGISINATDLPGYTVQTLLRMLAAYGLSLLFTLAYAYSAYISAKAALVLIPLLDILQSIPVLSFLPSVVLALIAIFPGQRIGVEIASVLLIFTGMTWNMTFSFYQSLSNIPKELREASQVYQLNAWQRFWTLELPSGAIGLVWNSVMSVAGGWFFLMQIESFTLGRQDFRLPGLGSFLKAASERGDMSAVGWGVAVLIGVIVIIDIFIWQPLIAWAEKFKFETVEAEKVPQSIVLDFFRRSPTIRILHDRLWLRLQESLDRGFLRTSRPAIPARRSNWTGFGKWLNWLFLSGASLIVLWGTWEALLLLRTLGWEDWQMVIVGAIFSSLRVIGSLLLSLLWTVPVGVAIGRNPRLAQFLQPLVQIAASVPATALFPVLLLYLAQIGGGLEIGSITLMMLGTMWYILFNVIAGAQSIPSELFEVARVYKLSRLERWRTLILPGIFPYLITGIITAVGGAWNASIVSEYVQFQGKTLTATGLGEVIAQSSAAGKYPLLLAATVVMSLLVVLTNRLVWRPLYRLAQEKYQLLV